MTGELFMATEATKFLLLFVLVPATSEKNCNSNWTCVLCLQVCCFGTLLVMVAGEKRFLMFFVVVQATCSSKEPCATNWIGALWLQGGVLHIF